jgi:UV DNA damage endonuclease
MNDNVRLGYACVNMTLTSRPKKLGGRVTTSRGVRKDSWYHTWDLAKLGDIALQNATDLLHYLKWNEDHGITLFRIGSELIPWADHYELTDLPNYDLLAAKLRECGDFAKAHGHRLSTHPGQFHILCSPHEAVVNKTIVSLERHSEMFDMMGFEPSFENKINIHIGGAYGNHEATATRWLKGWDRLSDNCKSRLVIENDDKKSMYSVLMLYNLVHRLNGIPITFDYYHHKFHTNGLSEHEALMLARSTWPSHIRQATHWSESRRQEYQTIVQNMCATNNISEKDIPNWPTIAAYKKEIDKIKETAHSDYIVGPIETYGLPLDIMIEAKAKELALLRFRDIYVYNQNQQEINL